MTSKPRILTFDVANSRRRTYRQIKKERLTVRVSTNGQFGMEVEFPSRQHRGLLEARGAQSSRGRGLELGNLEYPNLAVLSGTQLSFVANPTIFKERTKGALERKKYLHSLTRLSDTYASGGSPCFIVTSIL